MRNKINKMGLFAILLFVLLLIFEVCFSEVVIFNSVGGSEETIFFKRVDEGENITFQVADTNDFFVSVRNLPKGATFSEGIFSWTPTDVQAGYYTVAFYTDKNYTSTTDTLYKIINIIVSDTIFMIPVNHAFEYLFIATDPDDDPVELRIKGILPRGSTFEGSRFGPKLFRWTPTLQQLGTHFITLIAQDHPVEGTSKVDISNIRIVVTKLSYEDMRYDFNKDGIIDTIDFRMFSEAYTANR